MIIHSSFHDYYDIGIRYGVDTTIHWHREITEVLRNDLPTPFCDIRMHYPDVNKDGVITEGYLLFLAGKMFEFYVLTERDSGKVLSVHSKDSFKKLFPRNKWGNWPYYLSNNISRYWSSTTPISTITEDQIRDLHVRYESPVILLSNKWGGGFISYINPVLKDIGFQHILDPYTCFQEISMYMSGVMCNMEKETVEVSDIIQRDKKGFDNNSFKNRDCKKPRRKKK